MNARPPDLFRPNRARHAAQSSRSYINRLRSHLRGARLAAARLMKAAPSPAPAHPMPGPLPGLTNARAPLHAPASSIRARLLYALPPRPGLTSARRCGKLTPYDAREG